jgi:hypothetical protein
MISFQHPNRGVQALQNSPSSCKNGRQNNPNIIGCSACTFQPIFALNSPHFAINVGAGCVSAGPVDPLRFLPDGSIHLRGTNAPDNPPHDGGSNEVENSCRDAQRRANLPQLHDQGNAERQHHQRILSSQQQGQAGADIVGVTGCGHIN